MSRRGSQVEISGYLDTQYSSGDSNRHPKYQEENNNEVDELSKELSEMGCIVDAVKRPPNICVETCVYESEEDGSDKEDNETAHDKEEDAYSDEFEEDKSDEDESVKTEKTHKSVSESMSKSLSESTKLSKSQSSVSSSKAPGSISGRTDYGSVSVPSTRRVNMSFTNDRLREIERHNHILLTKILSARNQRKSSIPPRDPPPRKPVPSAAVMRKKQQRQIDHDNMILLKKIQRAKSSSCSFRR